MSVVARMKLDPCGGEPDEVLIKLIAALDENAMRMLYERHNARVFRFVAQLVKDEHLAEDVTSEAFLEVWR
jgi:RNA polymerase sigma-70 factor (ECF subfamily)